tara:strand:- start:21670 stop:22116 length:447 start_codon:yes stop_codon:yes gene_type:complete
MASGSSHIKGGFLFFLIFIYTIICYFIVPTWIDTIIYLSLFIAGALFPDVDIKSIAQKVFYWYFFIFDLFLIYNEEYKIAAYFGLVIITPLLSKHRGWTHSSLTMFLLSGAILFVPIYKSGIQDFSTAMYSASFFLGFLSHLILDKKF